MRKVVDDAVEGIIESTRNQEYLPYAGSLAGAPNIFLRSRYGVANPFSVEVPSVGGGSGSGAGTETGGSGTFDPSVDTEVEYTSQSGFMFFTQSGEQIVSQ